MYDEPTVGFARNNTESAGGAGESSSGGMTIERDRKKPPKPAMTPEQRHERSQTILIAGAILIAVFLIVGGVVIGTNGSGVHELDRQEKVIDMCGHADSADMATCIVAANAD